MDDLHVETVLEMVAHRIGGELVANTLGDLIERCDLVVISSNSNHIEEDLDEASSLRGRKQGIPRNLESQSTDRFCLECWIDSSHFQYS